MPVWLWVGLATMFFSALHIILDFGVGLFDLHGTLALTEAATLVGVALIQLWWAISFMPGARGIGRGVASAGILGAGWVALTNRLPLRCSTSGAGGVPLVSLLRFHPPVPADGCRHIRHVVPLVFRSAGHQA